MTNLKNVFLDCFRSASEIRIQWMRLIGCDDQEILDNINDVNSVAEEQEQLDAAIRLNKSNLVTVSSKSVSFIGRISGDMECFCWDGVLFDDKINCLSDDYHPGRLYPGSVLRHLGCDTDKQYKFIISVEEMK